MSCPPRQESPSSAWASTPCHVGHVPPPHGVQCRPRSGAQTLAARVPSGPCSWRKSRGSAVSTTQRPTSVCQRPVPKGTGLREAPGTGWPQARPLGGQLGERQGPGCRGGRPPGLRVSRAACRGRPGSPAVAVAVCMAAPAASCRSSTAPGIGSPVLGIHWPASGRDACTRGLWRPDRPVTPPPPRWGGGVADLHRGWTDRGERVSGCVSSWLLARPWPRALAEMAWF